LRNKKDEAIIKILCLSKQKKTLEKHKKKIIRIGLNSLDKFNKFEAREQKKHKEKTKREPQLFVTASGISAPANIP
jgi:hypothetical protein